MKTCFLHQQKYEERRSLERLSKDGVLSGIEVNYTRTCKQFSYIKPHFKSNQKPKNGAMALSKGWG